MVLKDDLIAQSTLMIPEHCQSGFLALLAKFDFAIPCDDKCVFVHCLLPKELDSSAKPIEATRTSVANCLVPNICKIYKNISSSFAEMIDGIKEIKSKLSEQQDAKPKLHRNSLNSNINEDSLHQDHVGLGDRAHVQRSNSLSHCKSGVLSHDEDDCAHRFPYFNIVDSASFEDSISSSLSSSVDEKQWLKTADLNPVLHPSLRRIWLASFIPDGFWPQLLAKIILDDAIHSTLSAILSTVLQNSEYTLDHASTDASSLWRLSQLGLAIEYDKIKLVELQQTTNMCDNSSDKYNLSEQYTYQIELTIHIRDIVLVHKQEAASQDSNCNVIRLATRILVLIEQHILDIGEEWFPGTISDSRNKQILSFVPCPSCISKNDDNTSYSDCVDHWFLHCNGCKVVCFSFKDLLVAYTLPSRSVKCPLHNDMLVQQLAPDMVSTYCTYCYGSQIDFLVF